MKKQTAVTHFCKPDFAATTVLASKQSSQKEIHIINKQIRKSQAANNTVEREFPMGNSDLFGMQMIKRLCNS